MHKDENTGHVVTITDKTKIVEVDINHSFN